MLQHSNDQYSHFSASEFLPDFLSAFSNSASSIQVHGNHIRYHFLYFSKLILYRLWRWKTGQHYSKIISTQCAVLKQPLRELWPKAVGSGDLWCWSETVTFIQKSDFSIRVEVESTCALITLHCRERSTLFQLELDFVYSFASLWLKCHPSSEQSDIALPL